MNPWMALMFGTILCGMIAWVTFSILESLEARHFNKKDKGE